MSFENKFNYDARTQNNLKHTCLFRVEKCPLPTFLFSFSFVSYRAVIVCLSISILSRSNAPKRAYLICTLYFPFMFSFHCASVNIINYFRKIRYKFDTIIS